MDNILTQTTEMKERIQSHIEQYREKHFWELYPCGITPEWMIDAFVEFADSMQKETDRLKVTGNKKASK